MDQDKIHSLLDSIINTVQELRNEIIPTKTTQTLQLKPGDDVNAAINSLNSTGGQIILQPGFYTGNIVLQPRDSNNTIEVHSSVPPTNRPVSTDIVNMPVLASNSIESTIKAKLRSGGISFYGIAFGSMQYPDRTLVDLGGDKTELTNSADRAEEFLFSNCLFRGSPLNGQHRGIQCNARFVTILSCSFYDFFEFNRDSQAICGWNGSENITIDDCYVEGGAENILFGGSDSAYANMIPKNINIRNTHVSKNYNWMKLPRGKEINIKALVEIKNVDGFYMGNCLLENNWAKDWPSGVGMTLKSCNSDGGEPWATMKNVVVENTIIRNVGTPFNVIGQNDSGHSSIRANNVTIQNVLAYNINKAPYLGDMRMLMINTPHSFAMYNCTILGADHSIFALSLENGIEKPTGFRFNQNVFWHGEYGVFSSFGLGIDALNNQLNGYEFANNVFRFNLERQNILPPTNKILDKGDFDASISANYAYIPKVNDGIARGVDVSKLESIKL